MDLKTLSDSELLEQLWADAGEDDIDPRLKYLVLQVSKELWAEVCRRNEE